MGLSTLSLDEAWEPTQVLFPFAKGFSRVSNAAIAGTQLLQVSQDNVGRKEGRQTLMAVGQEGCFHLGGMQDGQRSGPAGQKSMNTGTSLPPLFIHLSTQSSFKTFHLLGSVMSPRKGKMYKAQYARASPLEMTKIKRVSI